MSRNPEFIPALVAETQRITPTQRFLEFVDPKFDRYVIRPAEMGSQKGTVEQKHGRYFQHLSLLRSAGVAVPWCAIVEDYPSPPLDSYIVAHKIQPTTVDQIDPALFREQCRATVEGLHNYLDAAMNEDVPPFERMVMYDVFNSKRSQFTYGVAPTSSEPNWYMHDVDNRLRPWEPSHEPYYREFITEIGHDLERWNQQPRT